LATLKIVNTGREAVEKAIAIDPGYHWAGPYRVMGIYYREAPRWISFGDKGKSEQYFEKAVQLHPEYRLNLVYLGDIKNDLGDKRDAKALWLKAQAMPPVDGIVEEKRLTKEIGERLDN
jgi:tetratricopeptide (TPR) repeat protein